MRERAKGQQGARDKGLDHAKRGRAHPRWANILTVKQSSPARFLVIWLLVVAKLQRSLVCTFDRFDTEVALVPRREPRVDLVLGLSL